MIPKGKAHGFLTHLLLDSAPKVSYPQHMALTCGVHGNMALCGD